LGAGQTPPGARPSREEGLPVPFDSRVGRLIPAERSRVDKWLPSRQHIVGIQNSAYRPASDNFFDIMTLKYRWKIKEPDYSKYRILVEKHGFHPVIARLLSLRGLYEPDKIEVFLNPLPKFLYNPFLMQDMEKAVNRLIKAFYNKEKILIYGDYDVDGITGTSLLLRFFRKLQLPASFYIPDRETEGYGLSISGVEYAIENNFDLIITCDCGINAFDEIDYANKNGIDVIVTDHHEPSDELPDAYAVLDPKRSDDSYTFTDLCGVGVAYKLLHGFCIRKGIPSEVINEDLDLVAIGIAADLVPVIDENRILLSVGLKKIKETCKPGIKALIDVSGFGNSDIDVSTIVFGLAPRLNAAGRISHASKSVELLITDNYQRAVRIARELQRENRERQRIEKETIDDAIRQLNHIHNMEKDKIIILSSNDWHQGVIGIVASKIKEQYNKPVVLVSFHEGIGKGSARSIDGFDIYKAFAACSEYLDSFGGHKMAAGLVVRYENFRGFYKKINEIAKEMIEDEMLLPVLEVDAEIKLLDLDRNIIEFLNKLAPFGPGNMKPLFLAKNLKISGIPRTINEMHVRFKVCQDKFVISAIGWRMIDRYEYLISNMPLSMIFSVEENTYNGLAEMQLNVKDVRYYDGIE